LIPVIGLTTYNNHNKAGFPIAALTRMYITAIQEAGGAPVLIPSGINNEALEALVRKLDGLLLPGGTDISVEHYQGKFHPSMDKGDSARDAIEMALLKRFAGTGKPFLGICRGLQLVNVALGGSLYTHIQDQMPGAIKHAFDSETEREVLAHAVQVDANTFLAHILAETSLMVNSLHHQGIKDLAPGLRSVAWAPDGLVEAIELPGHSFGLAVQWHPEWLLEQPEMQRLFRAFVAAAGKYGGQDGGE
jgi:putative glutamine amidotransferase